ncbi:MAG: HAD hydrolase-like protein [Rhodothermales bacterium]
MKLLLFDIDGTLLTTNGAGRPAVEAALSHVAGFPVSTEGVSFSGKTDPQILREVLTRNGADDALLNGRFADVVEAFRATMHDLFDPAETDALDGATALVDRLHGDDRFQLALLTGNLQEMAYLKVGAIGFDDGHFPFGAFGSDHEDRNALPAIARQRALAHTSRAYGDADVIIIGDTPRDIECGRLGGCRTIAVATGRYDRAALAEHDPDVLLDSLTDAEAFIASIVA